MPDIIIDSHETARLAEFWLRVREGTRTLNDMISSPYGPDTSTRAGTTPQWNELLKLIDAVEEIRPLIEHLENLQMKRRHND